MITNCMLTTETVLLGRNILIFLDIYTFCDILYIMMYRFPNKPLAQQQPFVTKKMYTNL